MAVKILDLFKVAGDVDMLFTASMGLLQQVDDGVKQYEAKYFRAQAMKTIRSQLDKNNKHLNELNTDFPQLLVEIS